MDNPLTRLRQLITEHFNLEELRTLCFDLDIKYDELGGETLSGKTRELLALLDRHERIPELLDTGKRLRPDAAWAEVYLDDQMDTYRARRDQADKARRYIRERQRVINLRPLEMSHSFKDRVRQTREMCKHLTDGSVRLVSVTGRAGMGKTALVSRVLGELERGVLPLPNEERELSIDGILYLSARSTGLSLERIYSDVGRLLGEPTTSSLSARWADRDASLVAKIEYLLETMRDGLYLILLDNLEDVLTADGEIAEEGLRLFIEHCLSQPGGARLIATSRESVKMAASTLGRARTILLREGLPEDEAIALLSDLDPDGTLGLRDAPKEVLRSAVQLTQGIPRALEILAGILHEDPTESLSHLLIDNSLLGERVVERLVEEGFRRLGQEERRLIEALAVFDRPVAETAISYLLHPWYLGLHVRSSLRRLVGSFFVNFNRITTEYSLHPLDREYAYRQLPDNSAPDIYNRRNLEMRAADFYASIRKPQSEWLSLDDLTPQLAEFEHRIRAGDYDGACRTLEPIDSDCLYRWGYYARLIALRERLSGRLGEPGLEIDNLVSVGRASRALGRFKAAIEHYEQALQIARRISDTQRESTLFGHLGSAYRALGEVTQAIEFFSKALAIATEADDQRAQADHIGHLGLCYRTLGWFEQAIQCHQDALAFGRAAGDREIEGASLASLGSAYRALGQIEKSLSYYQQSLDVARQIHDRRVEGFVLASMGGAHRALGQAELAIRCHESALNIARETGYRLGEAMDLGDLAIVHYELGQFQQATEYYTQALAISREIGDLRQLAYHSFGFGKVLLARQEFSSAASHFSEALSANLPDSDYSAALGLAIAYLAQHNPGTKAAFEDALARSKSHLEKTTSFYRARYALAAAWVGQAVCDPRWAQQSERTELLASALAEYRQALENCSAKGVVQDAIRDLELIRAAGIEGLEPVFELLASSLAESQSKWAAITAASDD